MLQPSFGEMKRRAFSATPENMQTLLCNWKGEWEMLEMKRRQ